MPILSVILSGLAAPNADAIRYTDDFVCCSLSDNRAGELLILKVLHLMPMPSDALTKLSDAEGVAPNQDMFRCTNDFV